MTEINAIEAWERNRPHRLALAWGAKATVVRLATSEILEFARTYRQDGIPELVKHDIQVCIDDLRAVLGNDG